MKRNNDHYYSEITSFEDIRIEKARLILKGKLISSKINIDLILVRERLSLSGLMLSMAGEFILPRIGDIIGLWSKKAESESESGSE